jgi:hypothetical protein
MSVALTPLAPLPPWIIDPSSRWLTVGDAAILWNKHRNTIRLWCESGFFSSLNIPTYRDPRGRWFIRATT